jgi:hypothetical protein
VHDLTVLVRRVGVMSSPPLALQRKKAAEALDMSVESFDRHVRPFIRCAYAGSVRLYPMSELDRWLEAHARATIDEGK